MSKSAHYMEMVKMDGENLEKVPEQDRTPALCLEAVRQNGMAFVQ